MTENETPGPGHNSDASYRVTAAELQQFIDRIENVEDEIALAREGLKDVYAEAKARGYDTPAIRKIVKIRKMDKGKLAEQQAVLGVDLGALGMEDVFA